MKKNIPFFCALLICATAMLTLCGFSAANLADIETAVIKKDFPAAEQLAKDLIAGDPQGKDVLEARYYLGLSQLYLNRHLEARKMFEDVRRQALDKKLNGAQ